MTRLDAWLARAEAICLGLLVAAMTSVTLAQVGARYLFGAPLIWSEEAARYLFVWVSMIGAALAMRAGSHYALTALVERLPVAPRRAAAAFGFVVSAAFLLVLLKTGINETRQADLQISMTLPIRMSLAYAAIPVGAALMLVHLLVNVAQALRRA